MESQHNFNLLFEPLKPRNIVPVLTFFLGIFQQIGYTLSVVCEIKMLKKKKGGN